MSRNQRYGIGAAVAVAAVVLAAAACSAPGASSSPSSGGTGVQRRGRRRADQDRGGGRAERIEQRPRPVRVARRQPRRQAGERGGRRRRTEDPADAVRRPGRPDGRHRARPQDRQRRRHRHVRHRGKRRDDRHGTHPQVGEDPQHHLRSVHQADRPAQPVPVPERPDGPHLRHDARQVRGHHQGLQEDRDAHQQRLLRRRRGVRLHHRAQEPGSHPGRVEGRAVGPDQHDPGAERHPRQRTRRCCSSGPRRPSRG